MNDDERVWQLVAGSFCRRKTWFSSDEDREVWLRNSFQDARSVVTAWHDDCEAQAKKDILVDATEGRR